MTKEVITYMLTYIMIYSFCGWLLESISKSFWEKQWVNSGFLNGPICPIYGLGAILMIAALTPLKDNIILLFLAAFVLLSFWEYIVGIFLEKVFKTKYWDYSHLKFNFQGRICLKNSLYWGVLGVVFIRYIHPWVELQIGQVSTYLLTYLNIILYSIFIVDIVFSVMAVIHMESAMDKVNELGDSIKENLEELKHVRDTMPKKNMPATENIENIIKNLKFRQAKLKLKVYRQARRLRLAFPSMKSESITKLLNQKIDLETLKKAMKKEK